MRPIVWILPPSLPPPEFNFFQIHPFASHSQNLRQSCSCSECIFTYWACYFVRLLPYLFKWETLGGTICMSEWQQVAHVTWKFRFWIRVKIKTINDKWDWKKNIFASYMLFHCFEGETIWKRENASCNSDRKRDGAQMGFVSWTVEEKIIFIRFECIGIFQNQRKMNY